MSDAPDNPSLEIDRHIAALDDWRGKVLRRMRALIHEAVPGVIEEVKWRGVPVWSSNGILCTGETYKSAVKFTFMHGAALEDPGKLFNSSLEGNTRRALDVAEGVEVDPQAFIALIRNAAAYNRAMSEARKAKRKK